MVTGWLATPGPRPAVTATIGGRAAELVLEPRLTEPAGLPDPWSVWTWRAVGAGEPLEVVLTSAAGEVLLTRALRADGRVAPAVQGCVNNPAPDAVVDGDLLVVNGWLLLDDEPPARVEVRVDASAPVAARVMVPRADLAATAPLVTDAVLAGFEARVPVELAPGESRRVSVEVRGYSRDGREWTAPTRTCTVQARAATPDELAASRDGLALTGRLLAATPRAADPRHVLVVAHSLRIGGGELWLLELLTGLVRDHCLRVTVVAPTDGPLRPELAALGIGVRLTGNRNVRDVDDYESYVTELSLLMRLSGAGVVLANTLGLFAGVDAALRASLPVAWAIHESFTLPDFSYLNWGPAGLPVPVHQRWLHCLAEANALLFVADATRELFRPHTDPARSLTVRYGIDRAHLQPVPVRRESLGVPDDALVLLSVGVSEPRKGHAPLLAAFASLHHPNAYLVIVGLHGSPYCVQLQGWVDRHGLGDRVRLVPIVRDPLPWFGIADLFVNCSDIESLPRTILEAMALRVPVLAADVFGARELVTDGDTGWLFRPNDLGALTAALLRALSTPEDRLAAMTGRAYERVRPFLDPAGYAAEFAKILGGLADSVEGAAR